MIKGKSLLALGASSDLLFNSIEDLNTYLGTPKAKVGQFVKVLERNKLGQSVYQTYVIQNINNVLVPQKVSSDTDFNDLDGQCTYYNVEDMMAIIQASTFHKDYQTTYFNSLKYYINSMTDKNEVSAVEYGIEIPEQYQSQPLKDLLEQLAQLQVNENQVIENEQTE